MNVSWTRIFLLCGLFACAGSTGTLASPLEYETPHITKEGPEPPSQAIRMITRLIPWLVDVGLQTKIVEAMRKKDADVMSLLSKTGHPASGSRSIFNT